MWSTSRQISYIHVYTQDEVTHKKNHLESFSVHTEQKLQYITKRLEEKPLEDIFNSINKNKYIL